MASAGRILLRGGCVVSLDATIGSLSIGAVLVDGGRIVAVASDLGSPDR